MQWSYESDAILFEVKDTSTSIFYFLFAEFGGICTGRVAIFYRSPAWWNSLSWTRTTPLISENGVWGCEGGAEDSRQHRWCTTGASWCKHGITPDVSLTTLEWVIRELPCFTLQSIKLVLSHHRFPSFNRNTFCVDCLQVFAWSGEQQRPQDLWAKHSLPVYPRPHSKNSPSWDAVRKV